MVESNYFQIPNDWEYKGEGNCHLVLGLPKVKKVLSIRKRNKPTTLYQWFIHFLEEYLFWFRNGDEIEEHRDLNFYMMVMKPMLGVSYVSDATQVKLSRKEVRRIESQLSSLRPGTFIPLLLYLLQSIVKFPGNIKSFIMGEPHCFRITPNCKRIIFR